LDCSQLLKIELNGSSPINDTTKTHAIYECYCIISHLDHHGRWFCEFLSPYRLVQSVILIYFQAFWFELPILLCSKINWWLLLSAISNAYLCCDLDLGYWAMFWMWNFGGRVIGQCISYGRLLNASKGLNWMWCCSMGSS
jgi:hypothetical protein